MKNKTFTFGSEDIIGTLCVDDKLQGFLHYNKMYSNDVVEYESNDDDFDNVNNILDEA